jgi:hypothetical protein
MKIDLPVVKGIIFAGCSFTWGQGLYYYSNLPTLKEPAPDQYDPNLLTASHIKYTEILRFPRLVTNHFKTFEWVHPLNGGSHKSIIQWWKTSLDTSINSLTHVDSTPVKKISSQEISHIVFQLTQPHRCPLLDLGYDEPVAFGDAYLPKNQDVFEKWLNKNQIKFDSYEDYYINYSLNTVKDFLIECENKGLKVLILNWPKNNNNFIKNDKWLIDRFCTIKYKNNIYYDIETLMKDFPSMSIHKDFENLIDPPIDTHPSKKCHELIAQNIIKRLENE